jgi:hypothetical protein
VDAVVAKPGRRLEKDDGSRPHWEDARAVVLVTAMNGGAVFSIIPQGKTLST